MNIDELSFDNFNELNEEDKQIVLNDTSLLKILIKKNINEKRYLHSISVANVCNNLAIHHGVDPNKAYIAGLLHDCCKFKDEYKYLLEEYLQKYEPEKLNGLTSVYHSWVAKYYIKEKLAYDDQEVLNAIYNHTICNSGDKLSLILYIADKREPLRGIRDDVLELAKTNLNDAYNKLVNDVEKYLESTNERFVKSNI